MQFKDLIGLAVIAGGVLGGTVVATLSHRARDLFFIAMICLAPMTELYDVNFVSRDFYRGTVRGFEFSVVDILSISLVLAMFLAPRRGESRLYWIPSSGFLLLYALYCSFNVAIADPKLFGMFELSKLFRGVMIFAAAAFYVRSEREVRIALFALALIICYQGYLALKQRYLWGLHRVFGTVDHSNSLAALFCITAPVFVAGFNSKVQTWLKLLCAAALCAATVGIILTISRAGVVILGMGVAGTALATMSYKPSLRKAAISLVVVIGVAGLFAKSWETLKARFAESTLEEEYSGSKNQGRGYYIRLAHAIAVDRFFGVGLNNWSYWVSNKYGPRLGYKFNPYYGTDREPSYVIPEGVNNIDDPQAAPAHNLGALTLGELGIPGLLIFGILWLRWLQMGAVFLLPKSYDISRQLGVALFAATGCMLLQSVTEWVFRHSPVFYVIHLELGILASLYYQRRRAGKERAWQEQIEEEPELETWESQVTTPGPSA